MASFANILKRLREQAGLTQSDLSVKLNISKSAVSMYENGNREPNFELLETIADFFNVDIDYLTGRSEYSHYIMSPNDVLSDDEKLVIKRYRMLTLDRKADIKKLMDLYISESSAGKSALG